MSETERRELRRKLAERESKKLEVLERTPDPDEDAAQGDVPPEILQAVVADLAANTGAEPDAIEVLQAEAVTWNDGSLGCAEPGRVYPQVLVPGYRVILGHRGRRFDYRASDKGFFRLCERPSPAAPGPGEKRPVD